MNELAGDLPSIIAELDEALAELAAARTQIVRLRSEIEQQVHVTPLTSSDDRMHELSDACWCRPRRSDGVISHRAFAAAARPTPNERPAKDGEAAYWFMARHDQHDVGTRHEDGALFSATCHDCDETFPNHRKATDE